MASASAPEPALTLTLDDARRITLYAQGLVGTGVRRGGPAAMLRRLGGVQLDTISVLARSHELVAYARLGPIGRERVERAYWPAGAATTFEYWAHAACVLPIEEWPYYGFRRRQFRARGMRWHQTDEATCAAVLARLRAEGPLTATELGGAKRGGPWWDWSDTKIAVEWLLDIGEVICVRRIGWRRVYDLPERVLPPQSLAADPDDATCRARLAAVAGRSLGVVTRADLSDYHRIRTQPGGPDPLPAAAEAAGLVSVQIVSDNSKPVAAWADPAILSAAAAETGRHRTTLLSPFDSLVWDRKRTLRLFGFEHSLEAYVPSGKRLRGYFTMPLLARGALLGWVDPGRSGATLVAKSLSLGSASAAEPMARALAEAAAWVGCDSVKVEDLREPRLAGRLAAALAALGL